MKVVPIVIDEQSVTVGSVSIPLSEFQYRYSTSSGPGGQNVNRVNTKVNMTWDILKTTVLPDELKARLQKKYSRRISQQGELRVISQRFRDQHKNKADCHQKLAELLQSVYTAPKPRKKTKPSRTAQKRRLEQKRRRSETKQRRKAPRQDD